MLVPKIAKITRPILTEIFPRNRLFKLLDAGRKRPVTWIAGPPGCGKTTLVSSYLDARKLPCLWYQVDAADADPATFFYYLGLAAQEAAYPKKKPLPLLTPEYLEGISTFTLRYFEELYSHLNLPRPRLNPRIPLVPKGSKGGFILVFDNYQEIPTQSPFHEVILNGLSIIPGGINVFIISRSDPPPVLIRLRANHQMGILGWGELRLTLVESEGIVRRRAREKQIQETVSLLHKASDGWAAGLVLMLESVERKVIEPRALGKLTPGEIIDYFGNELFEKMEEETRDFLLKTAFFPKMTAKMAEDLTGLSHARRILDTLSRTHYFTEKRFHAEPVYQYHSLFREFLLSRAQATFSPEAWSILIRGAASLLEEAGLTEAAISLLHEAGDWDRIILLILKHAPPMIAQGRSHPLEEWVRFIPKDITENNAWLLYWMGACNLHFNPFQSRSYFEKAFDKFRFQENAAGTFLAWSGIIDSIWLDFSDFKQFDKWIPIFEELISDFKEIPSEEIAARAASSMFIALAMRQPQHPEIEKWSERALSSLDYQININAKISALFRQVIYRMFTGDFDKMALPVTLLRQLGQSRDASPTAQIAARLAEACYCRITGFHEKCLNLMHDGLERSRRSGVHFMEYVFLVQGIMSGLSKNDAPTVENLLEKMESLLSRLHPWGKSFYHYLRTREALARGDTKQASFHSDQSVKFGTDAGCSLTLWICHVMKAHVMHRLGKDQEAEDHLSLALSIPQSTIRQFVVQMARALFALDLGKEASGLPLLRKAFAIGREGRYFETHVDQPSAMAWLCEKALEAGFEVEYVQELIRRRNLLPEKPPLHLENWPWPLKIYTLGRFELLKDGNPIQFSRKAQQKPLTLLKALIAFGGKGIREDRVEDALWPEADGDMAHHSLEMTLHRLRRLIGHEKAIQHQEGRLTLDPRYCWVDAWAFERIAERADASWRQEAIESNLTKAIQSSKKAIDIYRGPFLAGEMVEPWTNSMSERLQSKFLRCVEKLGQHWEKAGHWEKAVECYQQGLEIDERIEEFYQHLIVAYHRLGQFTKARSVYNRKKTLSASSGIDPSPKTEAIYQEILKQEGKKRILKTKDQ